MMMSLGWAGLRIRAMNGMTAVMLATAVNCVFIDDSAAAGSVSGTRLVLWGARGATIVAIDNDRLVSTSDKPPKSFANITDISASSGHLSVVALEGGLQDAPTFSLYDWQPNPNTASLKAAIPGLVSAQISADGEFAALITCRSEGCDLQVWKLSSGERLAEWPRLVTRTAKVSWLIDRTVILVDGADGWIKAVTMDDHSISNVVKGHSPSISPNRSQLAYVYESRIRLRSLTDGRDRQLHSSVFSTQRYIGRLHWRKDSSQILANREAGALGYDTECLVLDVGSDRTQQF